MRLFDTLIVALNNIRNRLWKRRLPAGNILLLLPHCLQNRECEVRLKNDVFRCRECGRCKMKDLKALARGLGVQTYIASGGREAVARTRRGDVKTIVAVACRRELAEGICGVFPMKVIGVANKWPHGACTDTDVDVDEVAAALRKLIEPNGDAKDRSAEAGRPSCEEKNP